jgi:hypothetical protein
MSINLSIPWPPILVFLVFLGLQLSHTIDWSWWWVAAPLWGSLALGIVLVVIGALSDR